MADKLYMKFTGSTAIGVPQPLPVKWGNISGFNLLPDARLKEEGWMPLVVVEPPGYDPDEQYRSLEYVVNEDDITPTYTIEDFLDIGRLNEWCSVIDGDITGGPFRLPKVWDGVQMWLLTESEINDMDWFIYVDVEPEYDSDTEYLSHTNQVNATNVTAIYIVNDYTTEQMTERVEQAKVAKLAEIRAEAQDVIYAAYPIWYQTNVADGTYGSDVGDPMKTHKANIIVESNRCEDAIEAATTLAAIRAVEPNWPEV
jgi:hypothetical protein